MTNSDTPIVVNGITIDQTAANTLLKWLILNEKNNIKTKERSDQQMVAVIQKKIEEIVQCY
jgi:hypothetical protein